MLTDKPETERRRQRGGNFEEENFDFQTIFIHKVQPKTQISFFGVL
jgi:hypothetical protein